MEDQDEFLMRNSGHTEVGLETTNNAALLEDLAQKRKMQTCILPIKTLTRKLRRIAYS